MYSIIARMTEKFVRASEMCFALLMRIVAQRNRFDAALRLTRAAVPVLRRTKAYREQEIKKFHGPREIALHLILNALSKNGTAFNPKFEVNGFHNVAQAHARGKGVLVIGHHAALTVLMVRLFWDKGLAPIVITPDDRLRVPGKLLAARTIQPSVMFLVKLRTQLRHGELVCGMPDRAEHHAGRTVEFASVAGQVIFAPAIIQVAARCGAEVLFTEVHIEGRRLVATIVAPPPNSTTAQAITEDFVSFVQEQTAKRSAGHNIFVNSLQSVGFANGTASATEELVTPEVD
jgi:hypothetical protein